MRKARNSVISMLISISICIIAIVLLESKFFIGFRSIVKNNFVFLENKRSLLCNIFIGVLGSSFIGLIGFLFEYFSEMKKQQLNIIGIYKRIYIKYIVNLNEENQVKFNDCIEEYINDNVFNELHYCTYDYVKITHTDDIYINSINIMISIDKCFSSIYLINDVLKDVNAILEKCNNYIDKSKYKVHIQYFEKNKSDLEESVEKYKSIIFSKLKDVREINSVFGIYDAGAIDLVYGNADYLKEIYGK